MSQRLSWEDILQEHADALIAGDKARVQRARLLAREFPELLALMDLAEELRGVYRPVHAPHSFRARLRQELLRAFRRRYVVGTRKRLLGPLRTYWFWGAAIASLLSVAAGGVGYYLHRRSAH